MCVNWSICHQVGERHSIDFRNDVNNNLLDPYLAEYTENITLWYHYMKNLYHTCLAEYT